MRVISIRQPWAELILQGRKTIELRTWETKMRGRLAIHASKTPYKRAAFEAHGVAPDSLPRGALVGTVEVVEMIRFTPQSWEALREEHLASGDFPGDLVGWKLSNPERFPQPIPWRGQWGMFIVPDEILGVEPDADRDPERPFELRVEPRGDRDYGLALYQWPVAANGEAAVLQRLASLSGGRLQGVADRVLQALKKNRYKATALSRGRSEPFLLNEETGVRLGLLFLAIGPIKRFERIEAISEGIRAMPSEEAYYWFSKCTAKGTSQRARRALRLLLAGQ